MHQGASDKRAAVLAYHLRRVVRQAKPIRTIKCLNLAAERSFQQSACTSPKPTIELPSPFNAVPETMERDAEELGSQTALAMGLFGRSWGAKEQELPLRRAL